MIRREVVPLGRQAPTTDLSTVGGEGKSHIHTRLRGPFPAHSLRDALGRPVSGVNFCRKCRRLTPTVRDALLHDVCADCGLPTRLGA